MPTPVVKVVKMSPGGAAGGKHWTKDEVESRAQAEEQASRKTRVRMKPPDWLAENPEALRVWKEIIRKLKGIELLDNLDTELLAVYCDAIVTYREFSKRLTNPARIPDDGEKPAPIDDLIKATQAQARIVATFADKLGLTPGGRARLAKKKAEKILDPFEISFGG